MLDLGTSLLASVERDPHMEPRTAQFRVELRVAAEAIALWTRIPGRWALEALVLEAVREGLISRGRGGELLGLGFQEREELFARRGVPYDLSADERRREREDIRRIFGS